MTPQPINAQLEPARPKGVILLALLMALGLLLAASNVLLMLRIKRLEGLADLLHLHTPVNLRVPPLHGTGLDGLEITISNSKEGQDTLLFVFSPSCSYSRRMWPKWAELAAGCPDKRVVYANVGRKVVDGRFAEQFAINRGEFLAKTDAQSINEYYFRSTPITVLVNSEGLVKESWYGDLNGRDWEKVRRRVGWRQPQ